MRVLIVEDHTGTREAIARVLRQHEPSWNLRTAGSVAEALADIEDTPPHAALVDLRLGERSGVEVVKALTGSGSPCLMLTISHREQDVRDALRAGARGYLLKSEPPQRIIAALRELLIGDAPISSRVAKYLLPAPQAEFKHELTDRELDVLRELAKGHAYRQCAQHLGIKLGTVQTHVKSIYAKLGVSSKTEACGWALRNGLVD